MLALTLWFVVCYTALLQAAICPAFVSRPEGRKFLACLLTVHPSMVQEMTSVIRNQVGASAMSAAAHTAVAAAAGVAAAAMMC
jgi:hypothetical protein